MCSQNPCPNTAGFERKKRAQTNTAQNKRCPKNLGLRSPRLENCGLKKASLENTQFQTHAFKHDFRQSRVSIRTVAAAVFRGGGLYETGGFLTFVVEGTDWFEVFQAGEVERPFF